MEFLKLFNSHSDYNAYINSEDKVLPNVSYCENENEVHLNPWVGIIAKFNVTSSSAINIMYSSSTSQFSEIEIDGVKQDSVVASYRFSTRGKHTVKYTLVDPTTIGDSVFYNCTSLTSITIPNSVTSLGNASFRQCAVLTSITIPDSVTTIGNSVFAECTGLTSVTIGNSATFIGNSVFNNCENLTNIIRLGQSIKIFKFA